jgi:hypothetical protein
VGGATVASVIAAQAVEALVPKFFRRISAFSALTINGVDGFGSVIVAPSGMENSGT